MNILIEKAKPSDAEEILELSKIFGSESDNLMIDANGFTKTLDEEKAFLKALKNNEKSIFLLAKHNNKIIGTANFNAETRSRISHRGSFGISVLKDYWGNGVGTMLLNNLLDFAKNSAKVEIVSLEVRSDNLAAIHLYKKFGFKKIGTFKGYFKIGDDYVDFDIMQVFL